MKILFLNSYYHPHEKGGAEVVARSQVLGLQALGVDVSVLCTAGEKGLRRDMVDGIPVWRAGFRNLFWRYDGIPQNPVLRKAWHLVDIYNGFMRLHVETVLEKECPDLVVCHNLLGWSISAWSACFKRRVPVVQILHDQYLLCVAASMSRNGVNCARRCLECRLMRIPHRILSNRLAGVVGVSRFVLDRFLGYGYFRDVPNRIVIHNGCDSMAGTSVKGPAAPPQNQGTRFGFMGRLIPQKGVEELLLAFSTSTLKDSELIIAGDLNSEYSRTLLSRFDGQEGIRFVGRVTPEEFYRCVDVLVVPSLWEDTFPTVVMEALSRGVPVIGSRRGGIPEMIDHGETGLIVEPTDHSELEAALVQMTQRMDDRSRMAGQARKTAEARFDVDRMVHEYMNLYQKIVADFSASLRSGSP